MFKPRESDIRQRLKVRERYFSSSQPILNTFNILTINAGYHCGGCRARLKAMDLGSIPVGVRGFESLPPHKNQILYHAFEGVYLI